MQIDILPYAKERIPDVINFEENLRRQENVVVKHFCNTCG